MRPGSRALLPALLAIALIGCGPSAPAPTEGQLQFTRVIDRTLALQSATVKATLDPAGPVLGGSGSATLDATVDLGHASAHVTGRSSEAAAKPIEIVVKDGVWWIDLGAGFEKSGGGMLPVPQGDDLRTAVSAFATDPRLQVTTTDAPCGTATCHQLSAAVPPQILWDHFATLARTFIAVPDAPPADLPTAQVTVLADSATFDPVRAEIQVTILSAPVRLVIEASGFDQPVTIESPTG